MLCHIILPYRWEECDDSVSCFHTVHAEGTTVESLNAYPLEWAEQMFSFTLENEHGEHCLNFRDSDSTLHRVDGPAVEKSDGTLMWYQHVYLHREDGPAAEYPDGHKEWRQHGVFHRVDGPASEYDNGSKSWWVNGERHRVGGPAVEYADGSCEWWLNDEQYHVFGPAQKDEVISGQL